MKKWLKTILVTSMVVCFSFLMFACGSSNLVDVSGNYNSMTDADVQKFEVCETNWTKQQVISMEFKYSTSFTLDNGESAEMTASGMLDSLGNMSFEAHIIENLPVKDLSFIGAHEYGYTQYGQSINDVPVQYGGSGYILIGNGLILDKDTLHDPVKITDWSKVFIIEVENTLSYGQYELFINTLLRVKPGDLACLAKLKLS